MNTIEIPDIALVREIPSHWDEMSRDELTYCLDQVIMTSLGLISVTQCQVRCFYKIADVQRTWRSILWEYMMPESVVLEKNANLVCLARELTAFLFNNASDDESRVEINYDTIYNHLPEITVFKWNVFPWIKLYGPADLLSDLTFGEFRAALEEMQEYFDTKDEFALSKMIACLYRPERKDYHKHVRSEDFDGLQRQPFNRNLIEQNARYTHKMGLVHRTAVLLWYSFTIGYIQREDLQIGGRTINLSPLFPRSSGEESKTRRPNGTGWTGLLYSIAKEGVFGNADQTDQTGLFDVLVYMYDQYQENQRLKRKSK